VREDLGGDRPGQVLSDLDYRDALQWKHLSFPG
jgi:hypothetical protein